MITKLWIDDIRNSPDDTWNIARSSTEAIEYISNNGMPNLISFDHDLGGDDTVIFVIKYIIESYMDGFLEMPEMFSYRTHSANPVGVQNIIAYMNRFIEYTVTGE